MVLARRVRPSLRRRPMEAVLSVRALAMSAGVVAGGAVTEDFGGKGKRVVVVVPGAGLIGFGPGESVGGGGRGRGWGRVGPGGRLTGRVERSADQDWGRLRWRVPARAES